MQFFRTKQIQIFMGVLGILALSTTQADASSPTRGRTAASRAARAVIAQQDNDSDGSDNAEYQNSSPLSHVPQAMPVQTSPTFSRSDARTVSSNPSEEEVLSPSAITINAPSPIPNAAEAVPQPIGRFARFLHWFTARWGN